MSRVKDSKLLGERADWNARLLVNPGLNARVWQRSMKAFCENLLAMHSVEYCVFQHCL